MKSNTEDAVERLVQDELIVFSVGGGQWKFMIDDEGEIKVGIGSLLALMSAYKANSSLDITF